MNASPYDRPEEEWDSLEDETEVLPGRPLRMQLAYQSDWSRPPSTAMVLPVT